ncbi:hypothetical protein C4A44_02229 [Escherichia coli]|nr:hypothetical protein C4A44_02229 [Escherichia coli]
MASEQNVSDRFARIRRKTQHQGKMGPGGGFISWMGFTDEGLTAFWTQNSDTLRKQGSLMSSLTDFTPFP